MNKIEEDENNNGQRFVIIEDNYSYETILNTIAEALKVKKPKFYATKWVTKIAWRLDWVASTIFNQKRKLSKETAHSSHSVDLYSNEKAIATFDFQFKNSQNYIHEIVALESKSAK